MIATINPFIIVHIILPFYRFFKVVVLNRSVVMILSSSNNKMPKALLSEGTISSLREKFPKQHDKDITMINDPLNGAAIIIEVRFHEYGFIES
jgi:hypothetical protein